MKLIAGLGNPGRRYEGTRHNAGFAVVAEVARRWGAGRPKECFQGEALDVQCQGQKVLLLCPLTYMNHSGASVLAARDFYKLGNEDLLVVCDDLNLPVAKLRFRAQGSSGGQKGLADVIRRLGTEEFARLRIGIGAPPAGWDPVDYVLARFAPEELPAMEEAAKQAADAVGDWVREGIEFCMNRYN
jgi:PTH1 family peptidyl-tRNA hydrolase